MGSGPSKSEKTQNNNKESSKKSAENDVNAENNVNTENKNQTADKVTNKEEEKDNQAESGNQQEDLKEEQEAENQDRIIEEESQQTRISRKNSAHDNLETIDENSYSNIIEVNESVLNEDTMDKSMEISNEPKTPIEKHVQEIKETTERKRSSTKSEKSKKSVLSVSTSRKIPSSVAQENKEHEGSQKKKATDTKSIKSNDSVNKSREKKAALKSTTPPVPAKESKSSKSTPKPSSNNTLETDKQEKSNQEPYTPVKPVVIHKEPSSENIPINRSNSIIIEKQAADTFGTNLDDISMKFEENINILLQQHVISQRKFDEIKNDRSINATQNFKEQMKQFSTKIQIEIDLYVRRVERFFTGFGYADQSPKKTEESVLRQKSFDNFERVESSKRPKSSKTPEKVESQNKNNKRPPSVGIKKEKANLVRNRALEDVVENWKDTIEKLHQNQDLMRYVLSRDRQTFKTYRELKEFFETPVAASDLEKAWIVYVWITHNIGYDINAFHHIKHLDSSPHSVYLKGSAVAAGYSSLFKDLCDNLNIQCKHIKGYAKGFSYETSRARYHENHDWNTVEIDGKTCLVECTWGAGYVTPDHKFKRKFQPYYFNPPEPVFTEQHYLPHESMPFESFYELAFKKLEFFLLGLDCLSSEVTSLSYQENPVQLVFATASNIHFAANLRNENKEKVRNSILIQKNYETNFFEVNVILPDLQRYSLELFALNESKNQYSFICKYYLQTKTLVEKECLTWCQSYQTNKTVYLFHPLNMRIESNINYEFKIHAEVESVCLNDAKNNFFHFDKIAFEEHNWYLEKSIFAKGKLDLCVKYHKNDTFWTCFTYEVV